MNANKREYFDSAEGPGKGYGALRRKKRGPGRVIGTSKKDPLVRVVAVKAGQLEVLLRRFVDCTRKPGAARGQWRR